MGIATVYLDRAGALTEPPRIAPYLRRGVLRLRGSAPPLYAYAEVSTALLGRQAVTVYGDYVVRGLHDPPIILGEYWAEDGITVVQLEGQCPHEA